LGFVARWLEAASTVSAGIDGPEIAACEGTRTTF
jgi:hypothetical protein